MVLTARDETQVSNGAQEALNTQLPYRVNATIVGVAPLLLHSWNVEAVEAKATAAKNSKTKKRDDLESYVYRTPDGLLGVPGVNLHAALIEAGRYHADPRSPRKSARDLVKAGIAPLTVVAPFEPATTTWDYEDARRVTVQRAGITRIRPAMKEGWRLSYDLLINAPEYLTPELVAHLLNQAGRLVGLCDFRPTYGRWTVVRCEATPL